MQSQNAPQSNINRTESRSLLMFSCRSLCPNTTSRFEMRSVRLLIEQDTRCYWKRKATSLQPADLSKSNLEALRTLSGPLRHGFSCPYLHSTLCRSMPGVIIGRTRHSRRGESIDLVARRAFPLSTESRPRVSLLRGYLCAVCVLCFWSYFFLE